MEREKPLRLMAFVGIVLTMVSFLAALSLNLYLPDQPGIYRSHPVAILVSGALLILGLILTFIGLKRDQ